MSTQSQSQIILEEVTGAVKNYTRQLNSLDAIDDPTLLEPLCKLAIVKEPSKYKEYSIFALRNCCKNQNLLNYIKQTLAYGVIIQVDENNPPGNY